MQIGNITIEKVHDIYGDFWYLSFKDLEDPNYEYREYPSGARMWIKNNKFHREGGPAIIFSDGSKKWYKNGKLHREDGPALIFSSGIKSWYLEGRKCSQEDLNYKNFTLD